MFKLLILFSALSLSLAGQSSVPEHFTLEPRQSKMTWHGENVGGGGHDGTVNIKSGMLEVNGQEIVKGNFVIDMKSIRDTDLKTKKNREELEAHLMDEDFFQVSKFPTAEFSITGIVPSAEVPTNQYTITGSLSIKGVTNIISFPATVSNAGNVKTVHATITIDRTKWGVTYQSGSIFSNLKDSILSDEISFVLDLHFNKTSSR